MAVTTLLSQIRAITKSTSTLGVSDDNILDFIKDGCRFVISSIPRKMLSAYATAVTVSDGNGYDYADDTVIAVERDGSNSESLPNSILYAENISGASSLNARTKLFPGHQYLRGKLYIYPAPTAGEPGIITCVKVPEILSGTVSVFGSLQPSIIQYAAGQDFTALSGIFRDSSITELEAITDSGYLADFESALPTYSAVSAPVLPSVPSAPSLTSFPADTTFPVPPSDITLPTEPTTTLSAPSFTYLKSVVAPDFSGLDSQISSDDVEVAQAVVGKISGQIQEYNANINNEVQSLKKEVEEYGEGIKQYAAEWQAFSQDATTSIQDFTQKVSKYSANSQSVAQEQGQKIDKVAKENNSLVQNYNSEVQAYGTEASSIVQKFNAEIQAENSEFQANLAKAKAYLDEAGVRLQTMGQYSNLATLNRTKAIDAYSMAFKLVQSYVTKNIPVQQEAE
ncbi:MAG: hypothetical protein U9N61_07570 [Euryarchaeota archaeon]|nr:hypothetical protein [Euryarchaeota archaeon]